MFDEKTLRDMVATRAISHLISDQHESSSSDLGRSSDSSRSSESESRTSCSRAYLTQHIADELADIKQLLLEMRRNQPVREAVVRNVDEPRRVAKVAEKVADNKADFLKELPSYDENNFTRFNPDSGMKPSVKRPSVYISTKEHPSEQVITTEKTNILLRYLHQQWDRKNCTKRDSSKANLESTEGASPLKMPRLSQEDSP